ncbi:MAG: DnaA regulatory inactivator Hda [Chromatiales bacterium]
MTESPTRGRQLTFDFHRYRAATFDTYFPGSNAEAVDMLRSLAVTGEGQSVYLWGGPGAGKTHLLEALCAEAAAGGYRLGFLPLKDAAHLGPALCEGLETLDIVCVDDLDCIAGREAWEQALLVLYNALRDRNGLWLVSSRVAPGGSGVQLADFRSRLSWGLVYQIKPLADEDKRSLLARRASQRGLELSGEVVEFLLNHYPRDPGSLCALLERLDASSLSARRRVTIPFVKALIESETGDAGSEAAAG